MCESAGVPVGAPVFLRAAEAAAVNSKVKFSGY